MTNPVTITSGRELRNLQTFDGTTYDQLVPDVWELVWDRLLDGEPRLELLIDTFVAELE